MQYNTIETWHNVIKHKDTALLNELLHDDVVFFSSVVHTPQRGKAITIKYLIAATHVFSVPSFKYVKEIHDQNAAMLEFELTINGIAINGVDIISWNEQGQIIEFKVMIRPLKAVNTIHQMMKTTLEKN